MELKKVKPITEIENFMDNFPMGKYSYKIYSTLNGEIVEVKTTDKKIIEYVKNLGLTKKK